jgi:hypothetical protein
MITATETMRPFWRTFTVANATGKRVQELPLTPPRVLELLLDRKQELALPHIAEAWADNLVRPYRAADSGSSPAATSAAMPRSEP